MTGPLANEFAQVRARLRPVQGLDGVQCQCGDCSDNAAGFAALARIEEHTHNTEQLLRRVEPELVPNHDAAEELREKLLGGPPTPIAALIGDIRAALSAGEGTPA